MSPGFPSSLTLLPQSPVPLPGFPSSWFSHLVSPVPAAVNQLLLAQADQLPLRPGDWFKLMIDWILFSSHSSDINSATQPSRTIQKWNPISLILRKRNNNLFHKSFSIVKKRDSHLWTLNCNLHNFLNNFVETSRSHLWCIPSKAPVLAKAQQEPQFPCTIISNFCAENGSWAEVVQTVSCCFVTSSQASKLR